MKKNSLILLGFIGAFIIFIGCKKSFLSQTDTQHPTAQVLFKKPGDGIALVNAIYDTYQNADLLKKSLWYYANFQTHDFFNWGNDRFYNTYSIKSDFGAIQVFWSRAYIGIARANSAIPIIEKMKADGILTAALGDRLLGETYFLRGMTYYYLAASFGGVPLELTTGANLGLTGRSSQDSVFAQVESDLTTAANLLPWKEDLDATDLGRASKGAALGYLGSAQMWQKKYTEALASFNQLNGKYSLMPNFVDVNEYNKENNQESIFEVQFIVAGTQSWGAGNEVAWISDFSWPEEVSNFGYDYANPDLYKSYQPGDLRKLATVIGPGDPNISPGIIARGGIKSYPLVIAGFASTNPAVKAKYTDSDNNIINTCGTIAKPWIGGDGSQLRSGYYCSKMWRDPTLDANSGNSTIFGAQNQILLRYAEVLLSKAECQARTGDAAGALATLKIVRDRAFGGTAPAIMQDGNSATPITDPLEMCYSEYRHELTGEYSTFYDLRRAGVGIPFVKKTYGIDIPPGRDLYPIPQVEIGLNPNLTQNLPY